MTFKEFIEIAIPEADIEITSNSYIVTLKMGDKIEFTAEEINSSADNSNLFNKLPKNTLEELKETVTACIFLSNAEIIKHQRFDMEAVPIQEWLYRMDRSDTYIKLRNLPHDNELFLRDILEAVYGETQFEPDVDFEQER